MRAPHDGAPTQTMNVGQLEDFLAFHPSEVHPETELAIEVQTPDGATTTLAVADPDCRR